MSTIDRKKLTTVAKLDLLHELGVLSSDNKRILTLENKKSNVPIEKLLVDMGIVSESTITEILAEERGMQRISLKHTVLDEKLIKKLPRNIAENLMTIPIIQDDLQLIIATADVDNVRAIDEIKKYFNSSEIVTFFASRSEILQAIDIYYDTSMSFDSILREIEKYYDDGIINDYDTTNIKHPIVRFLETIILNAVKQRASDIHFEPIEFFVRIRYRIDGILQTMCTFHKNYWASLCIRIKVISEMDIANSILPQSGHFNLVVMGRQIDFRVSSHQTISGENIVIRILDKQNFLIPMKNLGYDKIVLDKLDQNLKKTSGITIITGPTGSGKTTSLYAMLSLLKSEDKNIMTLEDPVEYNIPLIRQSNIKKEANFDFADGLKSILRQDPDIIFIGEIRDAVTAEMAFRASMTGHKIFTTLHTKNSFGVIPRLVDLGVPISVLSKNISCAMAQRLVRVLCKKCKTKRQALSHEKELLLPYIVDEIYDEVGCEKCKYTGYSGRTTIAEIFVIDEEISEMVYCGVSIYKIEQKAIADGMLTMKDDCKKKIIDGITSINEVIKTIELI